jgi:hypothetical protein
MAHDVFISHSAQDRGVADAACAAIERAGHLCWIAPRDIVPGQDYAEAIVEGIKASRIFLLIVSANSAGSPQVRRETERAANAGLPIIPLRIDDVELSGSLEYFISSAHWLDATTPPLAPHLDYLTAIVGRLLDGGEQPGRALTTPPQPMADVRPGWRSWLPIALAGVIGVAAIAAVSVYFMRPAPGRACTAVPDVARTGFTRRATPQRSDKPLWLRQSPSLQGRQLTAIGPDEVFRVTPGEGGDWLPAQLCDGTTGFVFRRYVTMLDQAPAR